MFLYKDECKDNTKTTPRTPTLTTEDMKDVVRKNRFPPVFRCEVDLRDPLLVKERGRVKTIDGCEELSTAVVGLETEV